jgi:regulatory protein SWI6
LQDLKISPGDHALASMRAQPAISSPTRKSHDIISEMTALIESLGTDFATEIQSKTESLERTRAQLRAATRELADQRRQIQTWRRQCAELDEAEQRIKNLERAIADEDAFDWTGRTQADGRPAGLNDAGPAFVHRGPSSTLTGPLQINFALDADPPPPETSTQKDLVCLRRLKAWYERTLDLLRQRIGRAQGASADLEVRCKKIVAVCCGLEPDKVDGMLDQLLVAIESDGRDLDMGRVALFMAKHNNT